MRTLWSKIKEAKDPLSKFRIEGKITACIYPEPYLGESEVVRWFYSRNNACQVFFTCSKKVSDIIDKDSWAEVNHDFTVFVEDELMDFCKNHTDWPRCCRYGIEYDKKVPKKNKDESEVDNYSYDMGCEGSQCHCEPFGEGDFSYGIAEESEFDL